MALDPSKDPNQYFRAKLGGGQAALRILLSPKPTAAPLAGNQASDAQADNQSRVRSHRRLNDELVPRKKTGFVNFYDLGQKKDGSVWDSIMTTVSPGVSGGSGIVPPNVLPLTESDYDNRDTFFLSETGDWTTKFRKISKGTLMETASHLSLTGTTFVGELGTLPEWTATGLKLAADDITNGVEIDNTIGLYESFILGASSDYKVTTTPLFTDPSVPFTLEPKMDVFLVPSINVPLWQSNYLGTDFLHHIDIAGDYYFTLPRGIMFDPTDPLYGHFLPLDAYEAAYYLLQFLKGSTGALAFHYEPESTGDYSAVAITAVPSGPAFVAPPGRPPINGEPGVTVPPYYETSFMAVVSPMIPVIGGLVAIVKKGSSTYYFWRNS